MNAISEPCSHIVGIGASAGGLEALESLFRHMPEDTGMAFVVVQHLSPDFKSQMTELLSRWTHMEIRVAEHEMRVRPDTIFLMPPNREMIISGERLLLKERSRGLTSPIDQFFRSLASDAGARAVGVVLSGTGSDGSRGIREIHDADGLVVVQSAESAKFDGMPKSAIATGAVDLVLSPEEIPIALQQHLSAANSAGHGFRGDGDEVVKVGGMRAVFELLRNAYDIDFSCYKPGTITRRTERRLQLNQSADLGEYIERLRTDRGELDALYQDLLIGVTEFFRDEEAFRLFQVETVPALLRKIPDGSELRIWVAGCATGEEAYSLAILVAEELDQTGRVITPKIFATDVHKPSLEFASAGVYRADSLAAMDPRRRDRFFTRLKDGSYKVSPRLRQMIVFTSHNVVRDAPFTKLDLITCRNLLIYFQPPTQHKVLSLFHFGLKTGGVLFLGPSESPGELSDEFEEIDRHWKILRKRRDVRLLSGLRTPPRSQEIGLRTRAAQTTDPSLFDVFGSLLEGSLPPSALINERHQITHTFGDIARYLSLPRGRPSLGLLDMLEGDLKLAVAGALHRAAIAHKSVAFSGVRADLSGADNLLDLTVTPVRAGSIAELYFLVSLKESKSQISASEVDEPMDLHEASRDRMDALEHELRHAKENLQATIEELEASNEELQATNEELLASNEELQSTNEELHSVNEELYTVNAEYQKKISELTVLTDDMDNLLVSTEVHTLFLDRDLCIRKFTPKMAEVFNLVPRDIGRRLDSFVHTIDVDDLGHRLTEVLSSGHRYEAEVKTRQGVPFLMRILPYRGRSNNSGVVLTLIDIAKVKEWEAALREQVDRRDRFLAMLSHELRNPLGAVINALTLAKRQGPVSDKVGANLAIIERQSKQMSRLLDDLLDVSRITHGKIELRKERVDLNALARHAVDAVAPELERKHHQLVLEAADHPVWLEADEARILQVVDNLLTNSVKYTPEGGKIWVYIGQRGDSAELRVRDNGCGIEAPKLRQIFEMFVQGVHSLDRSDGGLGVGLSLVNSLVEMHGGAVCVHSDGAGKGSEFIVALPLAQGRADSDDGKSAPVVPTIPARLVLVEDQADIREPLVELLAESGYEIFAAEDGLSGLALIQTRRPDAALLDIGLPDLDGYEVARRVRATPGLEGMKLIALTGYGSAEDLRAAERAGFDTHLTKPVMPEDIIEALEKMASRPL